jgi:hypothetical protein
MSANEAKFAKKQQNPAPLGGGRGWGGFPDTTTRPVQVFNKAISAACACWALLKGTTEAKTNKEPMSVDWANENSASSISKKDTKSASAFMDPQAKAHWTDENFNGWRAVFMLVFWSKGTQFLGDKSR